MISLLLPPTAHPLLHHLPDVSIVLVAPSDLWLLPPPIPLLITAAI